MKKRLLFATLAMLSVVSSFALEKNEYVYTPQGRFQITEANINANSAFADFTGWTVVSAAENKTLDETFILNANGYAEGINSVQSLDATTTEGMYYKFEPGDANDTYVVSYKMKGSVALSIRVKTVAVENNLVRVAGNADGVYNGETDAVIANTAEELSEEWKTFNYAIVGDGTPRTYFISFTGMATNIEIADLQIAKAQQFADLRQRDAMIEKINAYKNCYAWPDAIIEDSGLQEAIDDLVAIGDESSQDDLEEALETATDILDGFLEDNMDDYLAGDVANYLGIKETAGNTQKVSNIGVWNCLPAERAHWNNGAYPDMGHFQNGNTWNNGAPTTPMGVSTQMSLSAGSYVFSIESSAALREPKNKDWNNDDGLQPAYAIAYIRNIASGDTVKAVMKDLHPVNLTPFILPVQIEEDATYEFGLMAYCKEAYQSLKLGSVAYVANASIFGKNENKYNQAELKYEENVRIQIKAGRDALTAAAESIADANLFWGKDELKACADTIEGKIAAYEAMSQDDIIATYDKDEYVSSTSNESGLLEYEVYQTATKFIIAANRRFTAVNDTLKSMQTVIDAAELTLKLRVYDAATGKDKLITAISKAKGIQAQMKASQYSEENAAIIVAANAELNAAIELFKTTVPASAIAAIVDIDFENEAVQSEETELYSIAGTLGSMEFSNFDVNVNDAYPYQQGIWDNGVQLYKGYVRVGNGTGTVLFDPTVDGTMGTNILKVNCDLFLQGLSGRFVGFYLKNETDSILAGFYANYYDNKIDDSSTLPIELGSLQYGSGGTYANMPPEGALDIEGHPVTGTVLAKNSFEVIMDFGEGTVYCTTTSAKGVITTEKVAFDKSVPTKFELRSNYINNDRRIWFDNLKIDRITAGEPAGVKDLTIDAKTASAIYTLTGVKAQGDVKSLKAGLYIINGKKYVVK